jgi:AcrR family transcriptional regulator
MGINERKERDRQEMRSKIIQGAITMFLTEGYEKTSIRNIAEKIEYSPATIYLYYKDKDELLYDVQREAFEKLFNEFRHHATATDAFERLKQISLTYVTFGKQNPEMYNLMFILKAPMNVVDKQQSWANGDDCFGFLLNCINECISQKKIRFDHPMIAALSVWSMAHGLVSLDFSCRFKVMDMTDEAVGEAMYASINEYMRMIKA